MPRYNVTLTHEERKELQSLIQKCGKGYKIRHAQILLKLDKIPETRECTYERIKEAYNASNGLVAGVAKRFVEKGLEAALGRKKHDTYHRKVTGEVEAQINVIACSTPPEGRSRWTMQMIADELLRLEAVDYITDSTVCEVMKKMK
jgi:transposase